MKSFLRALAFAAVLLWLQDGIGAVRPDDDHPHSSSRPRRRLEPNANIAAIIDEEISKGVKHPRFTLTAAIEITSQKNRLRSLSSGTAELFEVHVVLTDPSVTESTSISVNGSDSHPANSTTKLLVADHHVAESSNTFVILAVDEDNGSVKGIVQKNNQLVKWVQQAGETAVVSDASFNPPEDWTCGTDEIYLGDAKRHLVEKNPQHSHEHDYPHHHSNSHDHDHFDLNNIENFAELLGIEKMNLQKRQRRVYATDDWPNEYSYQVDMYIEVDTAMVNYHDPNDTSNMPNTVNYINALMTAISTIYMREIDTKLNVLHIASSNLYDSETDFGTAHDIMKNHYRDETTWHYTNSEGRVPDLHHGILYKDMGGGRASNLIDSNGKYFGVQCNPYYGYAISTAVQGSITDIDNIPSMFWDIIVVAHETGHNFGSGHTHDVDAYNPLIDECGLGTCTSTVDGASVSSEDYATIMSYCQLCSGGTSNIGSTFGGIWDNDDRSDVNNWLNTDMGFSNDPRRVPHHMYNYVASLGSCVEPYLTVDIQTCSADEDCHDGVSCTTDTCVDSSCINTMNENCCGNFICEAGEEACSLDCGPFVLGTTYPSSFFVPTTFMFDVEAVNDVFISSLTMQLYSGTSTVSLYTANGGYSDKYQNADSWTQIFSHDYSSSDLEIKMDFNENVAVSAGSIQSFYIYSTGNVRVPTKSSNDPLVSDANLKILALAKGGVALWSSVGPFELSFAGNVHYSIPAPDVLASSSPSDIPSVSPSENPSSLPSSMPSSSVDASVSPSVSGMPSIAPSDIPSLLPSLSPSEMPSSQPSANPSSNPSVSGLPSSAPSDVPSLLPSLSSSERPSSQPSFSQPPTQLSSKPSLDPSSSSQISHLYYPDWFGDNTCKNDGQEPSYMAANPMFWLHDTLAECCASHYWWKSNECLGTTTSASAGLYYPDWSGDNEGCLNDGNEPAYMAQYSTLWMHATLESCCEEHYSWNLYSCLGTSVSAGSSKWYMDWNGSKCVQDCTGASPCGGLAETWDTLYDSQDICCSQRMWWDANRCKA